MVEFPAISKMLASMSLPSAFAIMVLGMGIGMVYYSRTVSKDFKTLFIGTVGVGIGFVQAGWVSVTIYDSLRFRWILSNYPVTEIRAWQLDTEEEAAGVPRLVLVDRQLIATGLSNLNESQCYWRNHEELVDGYRVRLRCESNSGIRYLYLDVFLRSNRVNKPTQASSVVIPRLSVDSWGCGEFSAPAFADWFATALGNDP